MSVIGFSVSALLVAALGLLLWDNAVKKSAAYQSGKLRFSLALLAIASATVLSVWGDLGRQGNDRVMPEIPTGDLAFNKPMNDRPGLGNLVSGSALKQRPATTLPGQEAGMEEKKEGGDLSVMVKRLADKMKQDPKNGEGWHLLARTYSELRMHAEAAAAFEKAAALLPPSAALLADWVDAYVTSRGNQWDDVARGILKRSLAADGQHMKTLALAGSESFGRGQYKEAIRYWDQMKKIAPPNSMDAKLAEENIREANRKLGNRETNDRKP